jgi:hypothetical protein
MAGWTVRTRIIVFCSIVFVSLALGIGVILSGSSGVAASLEALPSSVPIPNELRRLPTDGDVFWNRRTIIDHHSISCQVKLEVIAEWLGMSGDTSALREFVRQRETTIRPWMRESGSESVEFVQLRSVREGRHAANVYIDPSGKMLIEAIVR